MIMMMMMMMMMMMKCYLKSKCKIVFKITGPPLTPLGLQLNRLYPDEIN